MLGLDDWVASASGGGSVWLAFAVAVLLGLRHAADPDHVAAVTTLVGGRPDASRAAARLGLAWGAGHATSLLAFGLPVVLYSAALPAPAQQAAETAVGVLIAGLAVWLLVRWRRGLLHAHLHDHGRHVHVHPEHAAHAHRAAPRSRSPLAAYGIGLVHGLGGSAGVAVLLLGTIDDRGVAAVALAVFAVFTAVSMTVLSTGLGRVLRSSPVRRRLATAAPALAVSSLAFGGWYALGALGLVPYVL